MWLEYSSNQHIISLIKFDETGTQLWQSYIGFGHLTLTAPEDDIGKCWNWVWSTLPWNVSTTSQESYTFICVFIAFHTRILLVLKPEYCGKTRSVELVLMSWSALSPNHHHPWFWLYEIGESHSLRGVREIYSPSHISVLGNGRKR